MKLEAPPELVRQGRKFFLEKGGIVGVGKKKTWFGELIEKFLVEQC